MINLDELVVEGKFIKDGDMKAFACLLAGLVIASDAQLIFEIGTGHLVSGRAFLYGLEKTRGILISCDPAKRFNFSHPQFQFIQKTSNEVAETWNRQIDILFIDGNHGYEQVLFDYKTFAPFIKKNGLIIFHDTRHPIREIQGPKKVSENATEIKRLIFEKSPGLTILQR